MNTKFRQNVMFLFRKAGGDCVCLHGNISVPDTNVNNTVSTAGVLCRQKNQKDDQEW
jgi:hypothetical protein